MINRKKKSQTAHQQKVERAHHRNEFLQDLKTFAITLVIQLFLN
jgi:hypothetical protein